MAGLLQHQTLCHLQYVKLASVRLVAADAATPVSYAGQLQPHLCVRCPDLLRSAKILHDILTTSTSSTWSQLLGGAAGGYDRFCALHVPLGGRRWPQHSLLSWRIGTSPQHLLCMHGSMKAHGADHKHVQHSSQIVVFRNTG